MMKKLILILCILQGVLLSLRAQGEQQNIAYTDNNVRFTVISDGTLRLEYAPDGKFVDDKSFIAVDRLYPQVDYKLKTRGAWIEITTSKMKMRYKKDSGRFTNNNLIIEAVKGAFPFTWKPGMQQKGNLKGTYRTLDGMDGDTQTQTWVSDTKKGDKLKLEDGTEKEITLAQKWPIRVPRPTLKRYPASVPLITGQRILDTLFPLAKGGTAAIPGPFGSGKTVVQHQLAKWSDVDIVVYIGCGERGNEMTQVLEEFSELVDPKSGNPLMDRTTLIANTSNMPVAAREASIYTGLTLAEYYRDMGYDVAIMADSTSRWAEALRELSGRLEEMPAEEGFPAYLASRLSAFYERAGMMHNLNGSDGSVTIIGAVSPQGGDFSEPVTQNTKRFVRCFWGLDKSLAYARHFPAIHWLTSYSEYLQDLSPWYKDHVNKNFVDMRNQLMGILNSESSLMEIVKLIGSDVLPDDQKLTLEIARVIRLGFLQQNAFHAEDTCVPMSKQFNMMEIILYLYEKCRSLVNQGMPVSVLKEDNIFERVIAIKYDVPNNKPEMFDQYKADIDRFYDNVLERNG